MSVKRLTRMALLTAIALTIFVAEAQLPSVVPIPGVKLGLANIVTVWAVFLLGPGDAALILLARVLLGSMFTGQMMALMYSLAGGALCLAVMVPLHRVLTERQIWVCSAAGAVAHNAGQLLAAIAITRTPALVVYFPVLLASGVITGLFTGLCAQLLAGRLRTILKL
jgi:heptaprenyl diphosphate synthase